MRVRHLLSQTDANQFCLGDLQLPNHEADTFFQRFHPFFPITIVHEDDYYDRDWTSMLAEHYSTIFGEFPRVVDRIHIFQGQIENDEAIFDAQDYQSSYLGFVTVYPCRPRCFGRSLLSAEKLHSNSAVLTCRNEVHLAGAPLFIDAFPFSGQDAKLLSCAHIAIWQVARYFSTKYGYYGEHYPADITRACDDPSLARSVPTRGLLWTQMLAGLSSLRLRPLIYDRSTNLQQRARDYLVSGIPVILGGVHTSGDGHAVVGIGLEEPHNPTSNIIVNDDNYLPYGVMSDPPNNCSINISDLRFVIVPLYAKIVVPFESAERHAELIELDAQLGLSANGANCPGVTRRVFLTSSKSYKRALCQRQRLSTFELIARTTAFPKFVWVVEYSDPSRPRELIAEYVLDATTSERDYLSFILLKYPDKVWRNDRAPNQRNNILYYPTPSTPPWEAFTGNLFR